MEVQDGVQTGQQVARQPTSSPADPRGVRQVASRRDPGERWLCWDWGAGSQIWININLSRKTERVCIPARIRRAHVHALTVKKCGSRSCSPDAKEMAVSWDFWLPDLPSLKENTPGDMTPRLRGPPLKELAYDLVFVACGIACDEAESVSSFCDR